MQKIYKSDFFNILNERGFIHQCSNFEGLDAKLCEGPQKAYIGFDATAKSLHIGNLNGIMMLSWFQDCGHTPITLMGGGTSKVGDPSFRAKEKPMLSDEELEINIKGIQDNCFRQFLRYGDNPGDASLVNNDDWLSELSYLGFLRDYGRYFTVNRMLSFEAVKGRLDRESPLTLLEFNYMVMQGYDFLELYRRENVTIQFGGSDQWGNIINGVDLAHKADRTELFALTSSLITTPDGKKMGKSDGNAVWLSSELLSPYDYYQFWRNVDDVMVGTLLKRFTKLPMDEIAKLEALQGAEINEAKKILAFEATKLCHGESEAQKAEATARETFEQGGLAQDLPTFDYNPMGDKDILSLLQHVGLAESKSAARRLIQGGGIRINDTAISDLDFSPQDTDFNTDGILKLSAGKKRHVLIKNAI